MSDRIDEVANKEAQPLSSSQIAQLANAKAQGKRPEYFADSMAEHSFSITMALMAELAVARERIDTLERVLASKGLLDQEEIEQYVPDAAAGEARQVAQTAYSARVLRSLQQEVAGMAPPDNAGHNLSVDEMARRLAVTDDDLPPELGGK